MDHRPRKRFGQNFLHDGQVITRIVQAIAPRHGDALVEIGPGLGALTHPLLAACGALQVIELDRDLAARLTAEAPPGLQVHQGDALGFDFAALAGELGTPLRVVGNLPYNISTPLLFHLIAQGEAIADMHFMLQREVVARLAAAPGDSDYGRLSVMAQLHCRVERLFGVPPGAFTPPPKVHSAIVRLRPHQQPPVPLQDPARFKQLVAQAFSQRRKTLRRSLRGLLSAEAIAAAGVDPGRRPQTCSLAEFAALANALPPATA